MLTVQEYMKNPRTLDSFIKEQNDSDIYSEFKHVLNKTTLPSNLPVLSQCNELLRNNNLSQRLFDLIQTWKYVATNWLSYLHVGKARLL